MHIASAYSTTTVQAIYPPAAISLAASGLMAAFADWADLVKWPGRALPEDLLTAIERFMSWRTRGVQHNFVRVLYTVRAYNNGRKRAGLCRPKDFIV